MHLLLLLFQASLSYLSMFLLKILASNGSVLCFIFSESFIVVKVTCLCILDEVFCCIEYLTIYDEWALVEVA